MTACQRFKPFEAKTPNATALGSHRAPHLVQFEGTEAASYLPSSLWTQVDRPFQARSIKTISPRQQNQVLLCLDADTNNSSSEDNPDRHFQVYKELFTHEQGYGFAILEENLSESIKIDQLLQETAEKNWPYPNLIKRILFLDEVAKEEGPQQAPLSFSSLFQFVAFCQGTKDLSEPSLTLSYEGNLIASWRKSSHKFFSIEFLPTKLAKYILVTPSQGKPGAITRTSAADADLNSIIPMSKALGAFDWLKRNGTG